MLPPSLLVSLLGGQPGRSSIARVERAHSYRARSASRRTTRLPSFSPHTHSGAYSFPASFSANQRYRAGKTNNVSAVEVKRPPMTTVASGR